MPDPEIDPLDPLETAPWRPAREVFRRLDYEPLASAALDDFQLRGRLWELIYALAGRRIYLHHTDHLTDCRLYAWLADEWLDEEMADIPPELEWNHDVDASDFDNGLDPVIWLRFFATESERKEFAADHNLKSVPAHEDPACDRDRWLPGPPGIPEAAEDDDSFPFDDEPDDESDPLGLERADAEIRAEKERQQELAREASQTPGAWERPIDRLQRAGVSFLPPDELTDETIPAKLWELLHNLACQSFYVQNSNHISDRELYAALWTRGLRDEALLPGRSRTGGWFHDCIGSGSDEHSQLWLRFHATDQERAEHARRWPDDPMPPREKPPFNRDWRLPKGPF
ncbi:MAG: hypothetical protein FJ398_15860 [Verrucomicrobia bacterium]|nr:hypothetical protein [Verrucomicrobiota bacterium]